MRSQEISSLLTTTAFLLLASPTTRVASADPSPGMLSVCSSGFAAADSVGGNQPAEEPPFAALGAGFRDPIETHRIRNDLGGLPGGIEVIHINPGGPAERAGLQEGDVLVKLSGRVLKDTQELNTAMRKLKPGDEVTFELWTGQRLVERTLELANAREVCDNGGGWACGCLADRYYLGDGVERNLNKAAALYQQACRLKAASGCFNLALLHQSGEGVARNFAKAAGFFRDACELGFGEGCVHLGFMHVDGMGAVKDISKAAALYQQACALGLGLGCHESGVLTENGWGVQKDPRTAAALYQKACDLGYAASCNNLGFLLARGAGLEKDLAQAADLYQKACDWGAATSCFNLGGLYERGEGVTKDSERAAELYQKACDGGDSRGCQSRLRLLR